MPEIKTPNTELPRVLFELGKELDRAFLTAALIERAEEEVAAAVPPRRNWRPFAAGLVAAGAAIAIAIVLLVGGAKTLTTEQAVAGVAQATTTAKPVGPNEFLYTKSISKQLWTYGPTIDALGRLVGPTAVIVPINQSTWISLYKRGRYTQLRAPLEYPTSGDERRAKQQIAATASHLGPEERARVNRRIQALSRRTGLPTNEYPNFVMPEPGAGIFDTNGRYEIGNELLTKDQLANFPSDPKAIYTRIHDRIATGNARFIERQHRKGKPTPQTIDPNIGVWDAITQPLLWFNLPIPPEIRANLVRALGEIPGVKVDPNEHDPQGRPGIALTYDSQGTHRVAIFDKKTGTLLSLKVVLADPKLAAKFNHQQKYARLPAGTIETEYLLVEEAVVNQLPDLKNAVPKIARVRREL